MRIKFRIILLALPLALASCSDVSDPDTRPATGTISVSVGSGPKIDIETEAKSRTELGENGVSVKWASDDQIALWAVNSRSEAVLDKQIFKLYHYNADYNTAKFTGDITPMPQDTYTYYAVSPVPGMSNGTEATYQIPAVQNGVFNGAWDVMVAEPVKAPALEQNDAGETVQFQFRHKVHVLKIRIPKNDLGEKVSEITLTFPQPVAGYMTVDAADPDAAPTLTSGSNTLTLRFDEPKDADDVVFAVIAPISLTAAQTVTITAVGQSGESEPKQIAGKNFAAGHTTPIAYNIPAIGRYYTRLKFSLANTGEKTLGEKINSFTLTAPEGSTFDNGSNVRTIRVDEAGDYYLTFREFTDNLSGKNITVAYDSENALIERSFTMPQLTAETTNDAATLRVPRLLEEDFSGITAKFDHNSSWSSKDNSNTSAFDLTQYGLSGWTGARVGGDTGTSIRISYGFIGALFANYKRPGRVDSCPLSNIKPGRTPKVIVSYTYCTNYFVGVGSGGSVSVAAGYTTQAGGISSDTVISNIVVPETALDIDGGKDNNEYYGQANAHENSFPIPKAASNVRLSWRVTSNRSGIGNGCYWFYLDNIKVSISNE